jgi:WD40 repeat protein
MNGTRRFLILFCCLGGLQPQAACAEGPDVEVICPAVRLDDHLYSKHHDASSPQPELVVLGKARLVEGEDYELTVEKVLYGSWADRTLRYRERGDYDGQHLIVALIPNVHPGKTRFARGYSKDAAEEKAMRALGEARLDFNALASQCIFLGRETEVLSSDRRTVEVLRPLAGEAPAKGQRVTVTLGGWEGWVDDLPAAHQEPEIYFIHAIDRNPKPRGDKAGPRGPLYYVACRQPADREAAVLAALRRRDEYPVVERNEDGKPGRYREVMFRGSTAEAIDLLGSESEAAVALGARKLNYGERTTRAAIVAAIEQSLPRLTEEQRGDHRRLHNLIRVLADMQGEGAKEDLRRLIERQIEDVAGQAGKAPVREQPQGEARPDEEEWEDVNHGLTWLLQQLDEDEVFSRYGRRLMRLRDQAKGRGKAELQLALDVCRVEDRLEVDAALARLKDVKPARSAPALYHGGFYVLAFSHDGKYLATAGDDHVSVWDTRDGSLASRFALKGIFKRVRFSPDDRLLYVAGESGAYEGDPEIHARYDWRTGKADRAYTTRQSDVCELELSADGRRMATADMENKVFRVTDTETGEVLRSYPLKDYQQSLTLSPDGKLLIRAKGEAGRRDESHERRWASKSVAWAVESLDGPAPAIDGLAGKDAWLFSPAGRYLLSAEPPTGKGDRDGPVTLRVRDARKGFAVVASRKGTKLGTWMAISDDGKRLAVLDRAQDAQGAFAFTGSGSHSFHFTVLSVPDLERISEGGLQANDDLNLPSMALSPDGKLLALAAEGHTTFLFDTETGQRVLPGAGHSDWIRSVHFLPDGKTVRTICEDNSIYLWDAATLRPRGRIALPRSFGILSVREPDARYLLCCDYASKEDEPATQVVDADTGQTITSVKVPQSFCWLGEHEVLSAGDGRLVRFDCRSGKVLAELKNVEETPGRDGERVDGGKSWYWVQGDVEHGYLMARSLDLATGKTRIVGGTQVATYVNYYGVVPGGKYFYGADPDVYLLDRRTLQLVARRRFRKVDVLGVTFTADGGRFAVVTGGAIHIIDEKLRRWDPGTRTLVRIHDALSGKTLGALSPATRWVKVRFGPDGNRLAVINDDNTIELWDLSSLPRP